MDCKDGSRSWALASWALIKLVGFSRMGIQGGGAGPDLAGLGTTGRDVDKFSPLVGVSYRYLPLEWAA
jgi:hypothetical protein